MITEMLPCQLTQQEIDERAKKVVALMGEYDELEEAAKAEAAVHRAALKSLRMLAAELRRQVLSGIEKRPVEVVEETDLRVGEVRVVRTDTGEVMRSRTMSQAERERITQVDLFEEAESRH